MANITVQEQIEEWLKPTLQKENLTNYIVNISGNSEKGDGYLGDITFVEVKGEEKVLNFVIKSGKKSKELRDIVPIRLAFENEIAFYDDILPTFVEFQREKKIDKPFEHAPKCYGTFTTEEMEVLVLENLKMKGYMLHDRRQPMDREHIEKVLTLYGRLHAISYAMKHLKPEVFKKLADKTEDMFKHFGKIKAPEGYNAYQQIIDVAKETQEDRVVDACNLLNKKANNMHEMTAPEDPYAIILHGDCWNNNFMFKYSDNKVSDCRLLDFQLTRLASPVYDLSYFLFTTLSEETAKHFDDFNNIYYESLCENLRQFGCDPEKVFPFEELMNQWKRFGTFGLVMMPAIAKVCLSDKDEVVDLEEAADLGDDLGQAFMKGIRNVDMYKKRTLPVMRLAVDRCIV